MRLPPFKIEEYFAQYEFNCDYMLGSSDPESMTMAELLNEAGDDDRKRWHELELGYTETQGAPFLRQTISKLYNTIAPEQVVTFAGAEEAIFVTMNLLIEPGDEVVVLTPCYQSLKSIPETAGSKVTELALHWHDGRWQLDLDELERCTNSKTRMIVVNFPHNPTGYQPDQETFNAIIDIARRYNCYLFSDEVYRLSEHEPGLTLPNTVDVYEHAISLSVLSKSFGLPGLRLGWLATHDQHMITRMISYKLYTSICNSAPSEVLANIALTNSQSILQRNIDIASYNLNLLDEFFARHENLFEWRRPQAGFIAFPRLKANLSIDDFALDLIHNESVLILPGSLFDMTGNHFRLGFGRRDLPQALERLERYIKARYTHSRLNSL